RSQIRLADIQGNPIPPLGGELADELEDHLTAHSVPSELGMSGEIQDVDLVPMQLVDHEADDALAVLSDHADAIPLSQDAKELFLAPRIFKACVFDREDLGHVATDHPPNVHAGLRRGGGKRAHRASFHGAERTYGERRAAL